MCDSTRQNLAKQFDLVKITSNLLIFVCESDEQDSCLSTVNLLNMEASYTICQKSQRARRKQLLSDQNPRYLLYIEKDILPQLCKGILS